MWAILLGLLVQQLSGHPLDPRGKCLYGSVVDEIPVGTKGRGMITSIGYPHTYDGNANCTHVLYKTIEAPAAMKTRVVVEITDMRVEPKKDKLQISEGYYPTFAVEDETKILLTSVMNTGLLTISQSNTPYGAYHWMSTFAGNVTLFFESDTEVNANGYKIKYAFNDCVDLEDPEHGKWEMVKKGKNLRWKLKCDDGYVPAPKDIHKFLQYSKGQYGSWEGMAMCTGKLSDEKIASWYTWVNSEYRCARDLGDCMEPDIADGQLVQVKQLASDSSTEWAVKCDHSTNTVRGLRSLHCLQDFGWRELLTDNVDKIEYPACVAKFCDSLNLVPGVTTIINSADTYKPGSYARERCDKVFKVEDMTRWCLPTGKWTMGQHCEQSKNEDRDQHADHDHDDE